MVKHLTVSRARALLDRHKLGARRSLGQHFLVDPNTVRRIVRLAKVEPGETILEVGPGLGSLTVGLAEAGARVVAIEVDAAVAVAFAEVVDEAADVQLVVGDALRVDLGEHLGPRARLVANLPYNVATPIFARVLDDVPTVTGGLVMVQRELGERWTTGPGSKVYGAISVKVAYHAEAAIVGEVPPTVFLPPPKVKSVLVSFRRRPAPPVDVGDPRGFFSFVSGAFGQRRKTLLNALTATVGDRARLDHALREAGIEPSTRPEQVSLESFGRLYSIVGAPR